MPVRPPVASAARETAPQARRNQAMRGLPQPQEAQHQQRRRAGEEVRDGADEVPRGAGVLRHQPHHHGSRPGRCRSAPARAAAANHGLRRPGSTRAPGRAATHSSPDVSSTAPSSIPSPCTTNEAFISQFNGEHTCPAVVDTAVQRAEVADVAGPQVVGARTGPGHDHGGLGREVLENAQRRTTRRCTAGWMLCPERRLAAGAADGAGLMP